ncbi:MAG: efflux RND transporter permease subunit, partial [Gemmatimonadota bacterium]
MQVAAPLLLAALLGAPPASPADTVPRVPIPASALELRGPVESVSGVGEVTVVGGETQEIRVHLDVDRMQARGVSPAEIVGALRRQNLDVPAGRLERDNVEHLVRVAGRMDSPEQVEAVVVANRRGRLVRLRDVARVEPGPEEVRSLALVSGERAVALDLVKVSGANTVEVADRVGRAVAALSADLPADTELRTIRDNSVFIRRSVHDVLIELMIGAFLTVAVVLLFLNDRKATAITSLALPISVISAFIVMGALSFTLNIVTLLGLSLSIGILIDDAIVVIESIVRHRQAGRDRFAAAEMGTREIVLAVTASTLTIVAVFVPVAFMGGIVG